MGKIKCTSDIRLLDRFEFSSNTIVKITNKFTSLKNQNLSDWRSVKVPHTKLVIVFSSLTRSPPKRVYNEESRNVQCIKMNQSETVQTRRTVKAFNNDIQTFFRLINICSKYWSPAVALAFQLHSRVVKLRVIKFLKQKCQVLLTQK